MAETDDADVDTSAGFDDATDGDDGSQESAQATSALEPDDGWSELHSFDLPASGSAELTIDGQTFVADVQCVGPGIVPDDMMDGNVPLNEFILFSFVMRGQGTTDEGANYRLVVERGIHIAGDRWLNLQHAGFGGDGQLDLVSFSGGDAGASRQQTPSSDDPDGALLPLVRVAPSGGVTAQGELRHEFEGDSTPTGPFTLAAQCQDGWPDDVIATE